MFKKIIVFILFSAALLPQVQGKGKAHSIIVCSQ